VSERVDYMLGSERERLLHALLAAYPNEFELDELVKNGFNPVRGTDIRVRSLEALAGAKTSLDEKAAALVDFMAARDLDPILVDEALKRRPTNTKLHAFHASYVTSAQRQMSTRELQKKVVPASQFYDPAAWRAAFAKAESRVCLVNTPNVCGTGFLVGPDLILTNHHVLKAMLPARGEGARVQVVFDYKLRPDGSRGSGRLTTLHADWHLESSPASDVDTMVGTRPRDASAQELDFVLARLAAPVGRDLIDGGERNWFTVPSAPVDFPPNSPLIILQHPGGGLMKIAMEMQSIIAVNQNGTRVRHRTYTLGGSSGSPCFDINWRLVAMHQNGDPDLQRAAQFNEGIPIFTIAEALKPEHKALLKFASEES
jgi:trypsin-like peptidase/effector-associated domain 1 (EAD1)-containing protein